MPKYIMVSLNQTAWSIAAQSPGSDVVYSFICGGKTWPRDEAVNKVGRLNELDEIIRENGQISAKLRADRDDAQRRIDSFAAETAANERELELSLAE